ncbi:conserved Plasmodium protein, unknown function [Plasmodium knowlesi strain H]|uniref:DNA/RNA-binding protein Alba-like domain-containing protein n=3 Tax=Plasmodium knowlesi TaxID=5850 RepID=A0A5K1V433_PLAKH|nr:DNA/RNA-binding protein, putative [Plasmodium knowlesi strain H]OTN66609.1 Uncharacterized protein PKNOH_S08474200 [Plasmodium knowlesi]CAA9990067.1 DNA/RNA-binding protein, putative [Plasmodium knowlesi strain H]SBO25728.1 conserved Plasmodium protein, unknown function [Plasmodium knowlesi strain H]SBO28539.1 conserved Plasmodium protein, unknown function [Plasmodium knowlesi strain H]VVS79541.1 DNA/RNA-binding protein, putative [Plasmodium knowlesi strain H]|eukprot:XP_002260534.1 hypothetical protein, conserved in Plasmodium species [Plasmodium knowlesi strain H]
MKEPNCYEILVKTESENVQKHVAGCLEKMKTGNVKIVGKQHGITKAFTLLELLKKQTKDMNHSIRFKNLKAIGPDRRKALEINIFLSLRN